MTTESPPLSRATGSFRARVAIEALGRGRPVVLAESSPDRPAPHLLLPADFADSTRLNQMLKRAAGVLCLALTAERCERLGLDVMAGAGGGAPRHPFTVTIEARHGVSTGISAADRARTVQAAIAAGAEPSDIVTPGHVLPMRAAVGGINERCGLAEAAIELCSLAGRSPSALLCALLNPDGSDVLIWPVRPADPWIDVDEVRDAVVGRRRGSTRDVDLAA